MYPPTPTTPVTQLAEAWDDPWGLDLSQNLTWLKDAWDNKIEAFVQHPWHRKDHPWGAENLEVGVAQPSSLKFGSREEARAWNHSGDYQAWDYQPGEEQPGEELTREDPPGEEQALAGDVQV